MKSTYKKGDKVFDKYNNQATVVKVIPNSMKGFLPSYEVSYARPSEKNKRWQETQISPKRKSQNSWQNNVKQAKFARTAQIKENEMNEGYGKDGIKQLKKDHADLKKNPPKIEKDYGIFVVKIYSNVTHKYIDVAEYSNERTARADLKHFMKDHKESLDKIMKLTKDVVKESVNESVKTGMVKSKNKNGKEVMSFVYDSEQMARKYNDGSHQTIKVSKKNGDPADGWMNWNPRGWQEGKPSMWKESELNEGLQLKPDVAKKLKASVASKAKGKIIPYVQRFGQGETTFGYTDAKGKNNVVMVIDRPTNKKETANILQGIRAMYSVNEGFGADTQKKKIDASDKEWDVLKKKHKSNKKLVAKACEYRKKNWKAEPAFEKAKKDLNESIDVVSILKEGGVFTRVEKAKLIDTLNVRLGEKNIKFDFGNPEELKAVYKGKAMTLSKAGRQYVSTVGNATISSSSIDGAVLKHPKLTVLEGVELNESIVSTFKKFVNGRKDKNFVGTMMKAMYLHGSKDVLNGFRDLSPEEQKKMLDPLSQFANGMTTDKSKKKFITDLNNKITIFPNKKDSDDDRYNKTAKDFTSLVDQMGKINTGKIY